MDRAAEGLVESVIKTYVSVLIPQWKVRARALANNAVLLHWCWPLLTALPSEQASPAQLCDYIDHLLAPAWLLIDHRNSCRAYTGQRWERIASFSALVQSPLNSVENSKVQWPQTKCCSTSNQMFLPLLVWGPWQSDCAAVFLADVLVRAPQANPQLIMIPLQWNGFLFAALRLGISEFLICKSIANLNEGKGFILTTQWESLWKWPCLSRS